MGCLGDLDGELSQHDFLVFRSGRHETTVGEVGQVVPNPSGRNVDSSIQPAASFEAFDGGTESMRGMMQLLLMNQPKLMAKIHAALTDDDGRILMRATQSLKSSVSILFVHPPFEVLQRLESRNRQDDLTFVEDDFGTKKEQIQLL